MSNLILFLRDRLSRNRWTGLTPRLRKQLLTVSGTTGVILLLWLAVLPSREDLNAFQPRAIGRALQFIRGSVNGTVSLEPYELGLMSLFTRLRGRTLPPDNIVLLAIDDESLNIADNVFPEELEETPILKAMNTWPWPRRVHARAVELLMDAGAKAVIFDVVFSTPSSYGPRDDLSFADILTTYGDRVALAAIYPDPTVRGGGQFIASDCRCQACLRLEPEWGMSIFPWKITERYTSSIRNSIPPNIPLYLEFRGTIPQPIHR